MKALIGSYTLKKDGRYTCGVTSFGVAAGHHVEVKQVDSEYRKVLVDFGDGMIDWFHYSIVEDKFVKVGE